LLKPVITAAVADVAPVNDASALHGQPLQYDKGAVLHWSVGGVLISLSQALPVLKQEGWLSPTKRASAAKIN